jgi:tetratricopeptide (TPR) repeat protein
MRQLITPDGMPPWYRGMRFFLLEETAVPMLGADLPPFVQRHQLDFSAEAMEASLQEETEDAEISRENRMQALLQLASLDYAHARYDAALRKYYELLDYYRQTGNTTIQAVVVMGIGDVYQRTGDLATARDWYTRAITAACESKSPVILFTLARNLGHVSFELKQYEDAERYFDSAQQLALQVCDADAKVLALEWRALSQIQLSAHDRAQRSLSEALAAAGEFEKQEHVPRIMERLQQLGCGELNVGNRSVI